MESKEAEALPFFLQKLWQIVCDSSNDHLICWSEDGKAFFVLVPEQFAHTVLPQYFKHRNFSSFVRQLNMYGFHKLVATENGLTANGEEIGFSHPSFVQNKPELLDQIKRKVNARNAQVVQPGVQMSRDELGTMMKSLHELKSRQDQVVSALSSLTRDKDGLWTEVLTLRQQVTKQDAVIKKLLGFIGQCVTQGSLPMKRPHLAITQVGELDGSPYKMGSLTTPEMQQLMQQADPQFSADQYVGASSVAQPSSMTSTSLGEDILVRPSNVVLEDDDQDDLDFLHAVSDILPGIASTTQSNSVPQTHAAVGNHSYSTLATTSSSSSDVTSTTDSALLDALGITAPKDLNPKCIHSCGEHVENVQLGLGGVQKYLSGALDSNTVDQLFDPTDLLMEQADFSVDPFTGVPVSSPPNQAHAISTAPAAASTVTTSHSQQT
ncbi:heat shock factor protein-like isoform X2 [Sycon ciliatum]|uniref:heat shock factor protein-like isoform X2 n=1 Tax=Sycon ciliatum TaxID=27933 RepID=UPI0031F6FE7E